MEQLYDYKIIANHSIVEQAHEIQALVKELEHFPYLLPDKFMADDIIAKLPPFLRDFATSLKHKRQEFSVAEFIASLDVEERARAKDTRGKGVESSSANMVQKKNSNSSRNKKKNKQENNLKPKQTTTFKKKKNNREGGCFVCGSDEHWASSCPDRKFKQEKKSTNMVISEAEERIPGYGNSLPTILSVCHSLEWWMDTGLIFMCVLMLLCFLLIRSAGLEPC